MAMHRPTRKLWLPSKATEHDIDRELEKEQGVLEKGHTKNDKEEEEDDLDKLLEQYDRQAEMDKAKVLSASGEKTLSQMGMKDLRETALAKPLSADTKTGLGVDEARKRQKVAANLLRQEKEAKRKRVLEDLRYDYVTKQAASFADRQAERHLAQARKVCETLDRRKGITEDVMWPVEPKSESDEEDDEVEEDSWEALPVAEKLADVLSCLRSRHLYCLFCGCEYDSRDAMDAACPGASEDVH
ncbi:hypothetical protein WJX75_007039 [Coccomyxa subellipsoidea]|uniref:DUF4187 domain-containing protein n=1 Tax=Coccomyxa subellipsoidea TaxID=248742 RepID=A0ABR2YFF6_9CHLO